MGRNDVMRARISGLGAVDNSMQQIDLGCYTCRMWDWSKVSVRDLSILEIYI